MSKNVKIQIFPDGRIQAEVNGIKGKKCTDFIGILEEILEAETVDSSYTKEFYEYEFLTTQQTNKQNLKEED